MDIQQQTIGQQQFVVLVARKQKHTQSASGMAKQLFPRIAEGKWSRRREWRPVQFSSTQFNDGIEAVTLNRMDMMQGEWILISVDCYGRRNNWTLNSSRHSLHWRFPFNRSPTREATESCMSVSVGWFVGAIERRLTARCPWIDPTMMREPSYGSPAILCHHTIPPADITTAITNLSIELTAGAPGGFYHSFLNIMI